MVSNDFIIRRAKPEDISEIGISFAKYFLRDNPLRICLLNEFKSVEKNREPEEFLPNHELTLIATIEEPEHRFAGFLMNEICSPDYMEEWRDRARETNDMTEMEIFSILHEMDSKFDIFERYGVNKAFHVNILSVDPDFRGKSIGSRLFAESIELARSEGEKLIFTDCTSNYTSKIAEKLGMQCIGEIAYENYRNENGEQVFFANLPHTHIRRFVKLLDL